MLDVRKADSAFHKALHVSYPNPDDRAAARRSQVPPGGGIMIHGQRNGLGWLAPLVQRFDWTSGCIALSDADMDLVPAGTPVEILP